ncbi:unnamed protein product, partial [Rotaria sp. Silwood2]
MTDDAFGQKLCDLFKDKRVLIIGDSIMRGVYRDICCVLNNNSRLLYDYELKFNRHNVHANALFGEQIELFHINRNNSTLNKEKRIFKCKQFNYYVSYVFNSRVWNTYMNTLLSSKENYDCIIIQSFIWDLTRYNDNDGSIYLNNLEKCLLKLKELNIPILWILLPTSDSFQAAKVNDFLTKLSPNIIQKVQQYSINLINLANSMKDIMNLRNKDGIHFTSIGHRHITEQIAQMMTNLQIGTSNIITNESTNTFNASFTEKVPFPAIRQGINFKRFNPYYHR